MSVEQLSKWFLPGFEVWTRTITEGDWGPVETYAKAGDIEGLMEQKDAGNLERVLAERETQLNGYVFYCLTSDWKALVTTVGGDVEIRNANGEIHDVQAQEDIQGRGRVMQVDCVVRR